MSKLPIYNDNGDINYGVPYAAMQDGNDCWAACLQMLYDFVGKPLDTSGLTSDKQTFGVKTDKLDEVLASYLTPHDVALASPVDLYRFLDAYGPALVVLVEMGTILHAQIITGRHGSAVFLNNPDNDFVTADMGGSGPFEQIEMSIMQRYGGISFEAWRTLTSVPTVTGSSGSPSKESMEKPVSNAFLSRSPVDSPLNSPPPSPSPLRKGSVVFGGGGSPQGSPSPARRGSFGSGLVLPSTLEPSSSLAGPSRPDLDLTDLRSALVKHFTNEGAEQKRNYIRAMEKQLMFRKYRSVPFKTFSAKFVRDGGFHPVWTLKDW